MAHDWDVFMRQVEQWTREMERFMAHVDKARAAVVEDAIAGVEAGRNGKFGLVIGVARHGDHSALLQHGADVVVDDLGAVELDES
jgi:beta-phosphoglucomutase-like phosphatase (HAD superfamily)